MANIKISQLTQYDGSDYSQVDVAGVDRQECVNVKVNLAPVNEIKNKVSDNTIAQGLTAGFAQMLLGNETPTEQTFTTQQTGGGTAADGVATYTEIMGKSVVCNQLFNPTTWNNADFSLSFVGNTMTLTCVNPSYITTTRPFVTPFTFVNGHSYLICTTQAVPSGLTFAFMSGSSQIGMLNNDVNMDIVTANASGAAALKYNINMSAAGASYTSTFFVIDLTRWYNGNIPEGLTADQFLADYHWVLSMGYNEGTIVNNNTEAIKTKDSDDTVIGEISVKPHYIEGGLKSAGSVYDSKFSDKEVQRVSVVDLSILQWTNSGSTYQTTITGIKRASDNTVAANILAEKYHTRASTGTGSDPLGIAVNTSGTIVCNTGTEGVAPSGLLIYELATPIVHEYEQAENTSLPVKANGMEEAISSTPSTPVKVMARYSIDVYQAVKDLLAASQAEPQAE